MYRINQFSKMVGLPQSKIRFYEKHGVLEVSRDSNDYRYYTHYDAFRINAFRVLTLYGFTVEQAVQMLDQKQSGEDFIVSLEKQKEKLEKEIELMKYRQMKIEQTIEILTHGEEEHFQLKEVDDYLYVLASQGLDFSVSEKNANTFAKFVELISITGYARIIRREDLLSDKEEIDPSYAAVISSTKEYLLEKYDHSQVQRLIMGTCVHYYRKKTRAGSAKKESFKGLFEFLGKNNLEIAHDVLLLPSYLNLDGNGSDIEILLVPVKKKLDPEPCS